MTEKVGSLNDLCSTAIKKVASLDDLYYVARMHAAAAAEYSAMAFVRRIDLVEERITSFIYNFYIT